jgi:hypothetical protein
MTTHIPATKPLKPATDEEIDVINNLEIISETTNTLKY